MDRYFKEYYTEFEDDLNYFIPKLKKDMTELLMVPKIKNNYYHAYCKKNNTQPPLFIVNSYKTAAENFQVIEDHTTSVVVPYGEEGKEIIAELSGDINIDDLSKLLRKSQHYSINVYKHELDELNATGGLVTLLDGNVLALKEGAYSDEFGLNLENDSEFDLSIF